ncbi:MAG TPA: hypothetical protein VM344_06795 [Vitreimonas sp.]|nr:hypothetical protein [Vitreimonas sp.]
MSEKRPTGKRAATITVRLTVAEWNALHMTAVGELEGLTAADVASGLHNDLSAAVAKLKAARKRAAR